MSPSDRFWLRGWAVVAALMFAWSAGAVTGHLMPRHHPVQHHTVRHRHHRRHAVRRHHVHIRDVSPPGPELAVQRFIDSFNRHDDAASGPDLQDHVDIVSESLPREFHDEDAVRAWVADLERRDADGDGQSDNRVTLYRSSRTGRDAYVVAPVLYSYQSKKSVVVTPARMGIALHREAAGWQVIGWAWTGDGQPWTDR